MLKILFRTLGMRRKQKCQHCPLDSFRFLSSSFLSISCPVFFFCWAFTRRDFSGKDSGIVGEEIEVQEGSGTRFSLEFFEVNFTWLFAFFSGLVD